MWNWLPLYPVGENQDALEKERLELVYEMKNTTKIAYSRKMCKTSFKSKKVGDPQPSWHVKLTFPEVMDI